MRILPTFLFLGLIIHSYTGFTQARYGVNAGIGISTLSEPDLPSSNFYDAAPSIMAGLFGVHELSHNLALYAELNYERRGADYNFATSDFTIRFNYISLPLQLQYTVKDLIGIRLGPQLNYALSKSSDGLGDSELDNYDDFDIGINLGVSCNIFERWALSARYYHGLRPLTEILLLDENDPAINFDTEYARNRHCLFGIQYYIH